MALDTVAARSRRRRLPSVDVPQVDNDELRRSIEALKEHIRMYEGDSGAPKERFVTVQELELAGLIGTKVQGNFALIDEVLGGAVTQGQQAGGDTIIIQGGGGGGGGGVDTLRDLTDTNVAGAPAGAFLRLVDGLWIGEDITTIDFNFGTLQTFNKCLRIANIDTGYVDFCHDGTDLNITGTATTDVNLINLHVNFEAGNGIEWDDTQFLVFDSDWGAGGAPPTDPNLGSVVFLASFENTAAGLEAFTPEIGPAMEWYLNNPTYQPAQADGEVSTAQSKFGTRSLYGKETAGLPTAGWQTTTTLSSSWAFTGDFTIECHVYIVAYQSNNHEIMAIWTYPNQVWRLYIDGGGRITFLVSTSGINNTAVFSQAYLNSGLDTLQTGQWYHISVCRSGTNWYLHVDGTGCWEQGLPSGPTNPTVYTGTIFAAAPSTQWFCMHQDGYQYGQGSTEAYIDNVRITDGVARYTSDFTAPTAPYDGSYALEQFTVGDPVYDTRLDGTRIYTEDPVEIYNSLTIFDTAGDDSVDFAHDGTDLNTTFVNTVDWNVTGLTGDMVHNNGITMNVQTGRAFTIDGNIGAADATTPYFDMVNLGVNEDRRVFYWREEANQGFYFDLDFSLSNPNNALLFGTDIAGGVGEMLWMDQQGNFRFGTTAVVYDQSTNELQVTAGRIDLYGGTASAGDKVIIYGVPSGATAAAIGYEVAAQDMYFKANQVYRWYIGTNADVGANNYLYLNVNQLGLEKDLALILQDTASGTTHSFTLDWSSPDYVTTFTGTTDWDIVGLSGNLWLRDGAGLRISNTTDLDYVTFDHDGTDFNSAFVNTLDWNVTGLTGDFVLNNGLTINVQTGREAIIIDGDIGDATTPLISVLNTGLNVDRRLLYLREVNTTGFYLDLDYSPSGTANALVFGSDTVGTIGEIFWFDGSGSFRFGTDNVAYSASTDILKVARGSLQVSDSTNADTLTIAHDGTHATYTTNATGGRHLFYSPSGGITLWDDDFADAWIVANNNQNTYVEWALSNTLDGSYAGFGLSGSTYATYQAGKAYLAASGDITFDPIVGTPNSGEVSVRNGASFAIKSAGDTDTATFSHDGTDFNTTFVTTTDWNISGLTGSVISSHPLRSNGDLSLALTGTVSVTAATATVTGVGTLFYTEAGPGTVISIAGEVFTVIGVASNTSLTIDSNHVAGAAGVTAYTDNPMLQVYNGNGEFTFQVADNNLWMHSEQGNGTMYLDSVSQNMSSYFGVANDGVGGGTYNYLELKVVGGNAAQTYYQQSSVLGFSPAAGPLFIGNYVSDQRWMKFELDTNKYVNIQDGTRLRFWDDTEADSFTFYHDGSNLNIIGDGVGNINITETNNVQVISNGGTFDTTYTGFYAQNGNTLGLAYMGVSNTQSGGYVEFGAAGDTRVGMASTTAAYLYFASANNDPNVFHIVGDAGAYMDLWQSGGNKILEIADGTRMRWVDGGETDYVEVYHSGTSLYFDHVLTNGWQLRDGSGINGDVSALTAAYNSTYSGFYWFGDGTAQASYVGVNNGYDDSGASGAPASYVEISAQGPTYAFGNGFRSHLSFEADLDYESQFVITSDAYGAMMNFWVQTGTPNVRIIEVYDGAHFRIMDSGGTDWVNFNHDGTDLLTNAVNTTAWNLTNFTNINVYDGSGFRVFDSTDTDYFQIKESGSNSQLTSNNNNIQISSGGGLVRFINGTAVRFDDSGNTDFMRIDIDGTAGSIDVTSGNITDITWDVPFWQMDANVGLTADVGSAQGNGVITSSYNVYSTVATTGDAATLPATFGVGYLVYIKNDGANSMDVFPASGDDAGAGTNTAVAVAAGDFAVFMGTVADSTWTKIMGGTA